MNWLPCVSSWATRIFGIAMRMTIPEVGTLVAVGARISSRALPAKTSRSGQASRSATAMMFNEKFYIDHFGPEHRGGSIASEDKIASCETVQASPGVP